MSNKEKARTRIIENIAYASRPSKWAIPGGMMDAGVDVQGNITQLKDPSPHGKSLNWIYQNDVNGRPADEVYRDELENFGKGLALDGPTRAALGSFAGTKTYKNNFASPTNNRSTRWGYRPYVVNKLAGGIDDSYHQLGKAVDIKHKGFSGSDFPTLQDIVVQALASGFRGIGFGGSQFHFDTRSTGFLGYTYSSWNIGVPGGPKLTPNWVLASILCNMPDVDFPTAIGPYRDNPMDPKDVIGRIVRDVGDVPDTQSGQNSSKVVMSDADIQKYIAPLYRVEGESARTSRNTVGTVAGITILLGLIFGGIYGFRRFLRGRREKQEAQRIALDQKKRVIISRFRANNKRNIERAKKDPELAARLEQELRAEFELFGIKLD